MISRHSNPQDTASAAGHHYSTLRASSPITIGSPTFEDGGRVVLYHPIQLWISQVAAYIGRFFASCPFPC